MTAKPQEKPIPGRYRHFKGAHYEVIDNVTHSETQESLVLYRCLYGDFDLWVRPLALFMSTVELDGTQVPRFTYVGQAT